MIVSSCIVRPLASGSKDRSRQCVRSPLPRQRFGTPDQLRGMASRRRICILCLILTRGRRSCPTSLRLKAVTWRSFTPTRTLHGYPPAETEIAAAMCVSPPSVNQMVKMLEKKGLISAPAGSAPNDPGPGPGGRDPAWNNRKPAASPTRPGQAARPPGTVSRNDSGEPVRPFGLPDERARQRKVRRQGRQPRDRNPRRPDARRICITPSSTRTTVGNNTCTSFSSANVRSIPTGPTYGIPDPSPGKKGRGDARTTRLDDLHLKPDRVFGYWFDFGDDWFHQVEVERIEQAIPTVTYPRVIKRVGKSPPQYR